MGFLIIGLGSMGSRRIRCLNALGHTDIVGFDIRPDRRQQAKEKYGIKTTESIDLAEDTVVFICTPPKYHKHYSDLVTPRKCFIEAGTQKLQYGSPSATMMYHPVIQALPDEMADIGKIVNISYHSGQYLPDWHPYEKVSDFYVSEEGAREMVAFELMWFCKIFGLPDYFNGMHRNTTEIEGLKAPDTYCIVMDKNDGVFSIMVDVVARKPIRSLIINGTERQISYNLNIGISEQMYIEETKAFLDDTLCNTIAFNNSIIDIVQAI